MGKVLLIRSQKQGKLTQRYLQERGIASELISLSRVTYPYHHLKHLDLSRFDTVLLSSSNSLTALSEGQVKQLKLKHILSVTQLDKRSFPKAEHFANMTEILNYITQHDLKGSMLWLRGNYTALTKAQVSLLKARGCVSKLGYRISYICDDFGRIEIGLRSGVYTEMLCFSRKATEHFCKLIRRYKLEPQLSRLKFCCLSKVIASSFDRFKGTDIVIAKQSNLKSLVACLDYPLVK